MLAIVDSIKKVDETVDDTFLVELNKLFYFFFVLIISTLHESLKAFVIHIHFPVVTFDSGPYNFVLL